MLPQQYGLPSMARPQLQNSPAPTAMKLRPPDTAVGATRVAVVPSPSCPLPLKPQQNAERAAVTAHVCARPALIPVNLNPPYTGFGVARDTVSRSPSWP